MNKDVAAQRCAVCHAVLHSETHYYIGSEPACSQACASADVDMVRRTNLNTGLYMRIPFSFAVNELAMQTSAARFDSRMEIVCALAEGEAIEVGIYSYKLED
jgi:hypothetical protein